LLPLYRAAIAAALVVYMRSASAETIRIDLHGAIERAHRVSPVAARLRGEVATAEAGVTGANVAFLANPELEADAGPRFVQPNIDADVELAQPLELGRRGPRRALAGAELERAKASVDASLRTLDLEVATAFYNTVYADRVVELSKRTEDLATRAAEVADRRRRAGDITDLDADLARAAAGRARSAALAAASERTAAAGKLAVLIGAAPGDTIAVTADLRQLAPPSPAGQRADLRALDAERKVGEAAHEAAVANARPDLGVFVTFRREAGDPIILGGIRLGLPVWNQGQGEKARANAHASTAREQLEATTRVATREVADATDAFTHAHDAVESYERDVLPALDDAEQLLDKSIAAGQLAINEYLVERQELVNGRREYLDRLLALARAHAALQFAAGATP